MSKRRRSNEKHGGASATTTPVVAEARPRRAAEFVGPPAAEAASARFTALAGRCAEGDVSVERLRLFGFDCLRVAGKVFAKLDRDAIVLRLPVERIEALLSRGSIAPYASSRGRAWTDWATVRSATDDELHAMAVEARRFTAKLPR